MLPLHAIEAACGDTLISGLKGISLIDPDDLSAQPKWHIKPSVQELAFKAGRAAFFISHRHFTGRLIGKPVDTPNGEAHEYALAFNIPGVRSTVEYLKAKIQNRRIHALCTYQDDSRRLVQNMRLLGSDDSGDSGAKNGYAFTGSSQLLKPAPWIGALVNVIGPPYVPPADPGGGETGFDPTPIVTTNSTYTYNLPAGKFLMAIFIKSTEDQTVSIGYSAGQSELAGPQEMYAHQKQKFGDNWILSDVALNIYISGLEGTNQIQICVL